MLIVQNVLSEVFYFLILALLMIIAFAQCATCLFNDKEKGILPFFKDIGHSCGTLFIAMLGIMDESQVNEMREKYVWMGPLIMILYLLITSVILLNLLIAILSNIYKKIDEKSNEEWMFLWGSTVMRLQKEVTETLPAPYNVVLKLVNLLPKQVRQSIIFFVLMTSAYIPGFLIGTSLYLPYRIFNFLCVIFNPMNWRKAVSNPMKGSVISVDRMGSSMQQNSDAGRRFVLSKFWEDNFTNSQAEMRGRDDVTYEYDSKNRATIHDLEMLKDTDHEAYLTKLQSKREDVKELLSVSSGDTANLVADVLMGQDGHTKHFEEHTIILGKLKVQIMQLEKLIHIANRNINALSKAQLNSASGGDQAKDRNADAANKKDVDIDGFGDALKSSLIGLGRQHRSTKPFTRPRKTTKISLKL